MQTWGSIHVKTQPAKKMPLAPLHALLALIIADFSGLDKYFFPAILYLTVLSNSAGREAAALHYIIF